MKSFVQAWHYRLSYSGSSFTVYLNERVVGNIKKPSSGRWPVYATINDRLYSFSKKSFLKTLIEVADAVSEEPVGVIHIPYFSLFFPYATVRLFEGEVLTWKADSFFSLHWKWEQNGGEIMEAIDNLAGEPNSGVLAIPEYKQGTELLIIAGFFLSLSRRSKLSMGLRGLKRKAVNF